MAVHGRDNFKNFVNVSEKNEDWSPKWFLEPVWQNYSSMYREAVSAQEATSGMEIAHHRMATLYFGISAIESFLNRAMTTFLRKRGKDHDEIYQVLRRPYFKDKLKKWPRELTGRELRLRDGSIEKILEITDLRNQMTHLKNSWPDAYQQLEQTDPQRIVDLVAEFIVAFHEAKGELFPYWIWGWNYLNPRADRHDIDLLPASQFLHSVSVLGFKFKQQDMFGTGPQDKEIMSNFAGYRAVAGFLASCERCEPKWDRAPYQPKLCRRWWDPAHHRTCGKVTQEAIERAMAIDAAYARRANLQSILTPALSVVSSRVRGAMRWFSRWFQ